MTKKKLYAKGLSINKLNPFLVSFTYINFYQP